jgi:hypothetical protein
MKTIKKPGGLGRALVILDRIEGDYISNVRQSHYYVNNPFADLWSKKV